MTPTQLETEVLEELAVLAAGETPDAVDSDKVYERYERLHTRWVSLGLAYWNFDEEIPDEAADAVVLLVAHTLINSFMVPPQQAAAIQWQAHDPRNPKNADSVLTRLSKGMIGPRAGTPLSTEATAF